MFIQVREQSVSPIAEQRQARFAEVASKVASAISRQKVGVTFDPSIVPPAPAWSNERSIWFAKEQFPDLTTPTGVVQARGLLLHELGHILFTPRRGSRLSQLINSDFKTMHRNFRAMNALEDQRLESLLVAKFKRAVAPWFTAMVVQYLLASPEMVSVQFPLIYGRKYLPLEVRQMVRDAFLFPELDAEFAEVIDAYRKVVFPRDADYAFELVKRYADLMERVQTQLPPQDGGCVFPTGCTDGEKTDNYEATPSTKPVKVEEQEQLVEEMEKTDGEETTPPTDPSDDASNDPSDGGDADGDEDTDTDGDADGDTDTDGDEDTDTDGEPIDTDRGGDRFVPVQPSGDAPSDEPSDAPSEDGGTTAGTQSATGLPEVLEQVIERVMADLSQQVSAQMEALGGNGELQPYGEPEPKDAKTTESRPSDNAPRIAGLFADELRRLKADHEPAWERETPDGKLNVKRFALEEDIDFDKVFDRWQDGKQDATSIETVICLDTSGSMSSDAPLAFQSMWQVKRALDSLGDANTTVVCYDSDTRILYRASDRTTSTIKTSPVGGGTNPVSAIAYANDVLARSDKPIKLLINITDGDWAYEAECNEMVKAMRKAGVLTGLAFIGQTAVEQVNAHESEVVTAVQSGADLLKFGRAMVNLGIARHLSK
jgi:hypothetical protein